MEASKLEEMEAEEEMNCLQVFGLAEVPAISCQESRELQIMATIKAPVFEAKKRAAMDLVCIVDKSGSMSGIKVALVKKTIGFVIEQLNAEDSLAIVSYDNNVVMDLNLRAMDEHGKNLAKKTTDEIQTGGSTNLCGGLAAGVEEMRQRKKNTVASCLLFTDGLANVGFTSAADILNAVLYPNNSVQQSWGSSIFSLSSSFYNWLFPSATPSSASLPCTINTFGFGSDHDPNLLSTIAERADGIYYYVQNAEDIPKAFANCLGGLVSVVAQNISLRFEAEGGATVKKVLTKFKQESSSDSKSATVTIGDIQSQEMRNVLCTLQVPAFKGGEIASQSIAKITVTYFNAITSRLENATTNVTISRPKKVDAADKQRNHKLDVEYNRILGAQAMEESVQKGNSGDLDQARTILDTAINVINASVSAKDPFCVSLVEDIKKCKDKLRTNQEFNDYGKQMMMTNSIAHFTERSSDMSWGGQERYSTISRGTMTRKFQ